MGDSIELLVDWFRARCDGDWEHGEGVRIETLDNPGWALDVDLDATELAGIQVDWVRDAVDDDVAWLHWRSTGHKFEARCGVGDLGRAADAFRTFAGTYG